MQFDLFTFLASLFNFLVLLALLRAFLWKPVTKAMDERESRIQGSWDEAERERDEAEQLREEYEQKMNELDAEREEMLASTRDELEREKRRRLDEIRGEVDSRREEWLAGLRGDQDRLRRAIRSEVAHATVDSTAAALEALAGTSLAARMTERLLEEIDAGREELADSMRGATVEVTTSERLDDDRRRRLEERLREIGEPGGIEFTEADELICGVRLQVGDREIGWSVADHVAELESRIADLVEERS